MHSNSADHLTGFEGNSLVALIEVTLRDTSSVFPGLSSIVTRRLLAKSAGNDGLKAEFNSQPSQSFNSSGEKNVLRLEQT